MKQSWRVFWFGVAFVVFTVVTYLAFFHARFRSVPGPSFFSLAWWLERIEIQPEGRISHVEPGVDFTCISALPDGREIWVGGSKGVIIHSKDGGRTWEQLPTVTAEGELSRPSNEKAEPPEQQQKQEQQKKLLPLPPKSKSKAFYFRPSASSSFIAGNFEKNEWIRVGLPETKAKRPPPNPANQAAPGLELPNAAKNLQIEKGPANSANQAAPALRPSKTQDGVTGIPGIQNQASPTPQLKSSLMSNEITDLCYVTDSVGYALSSYGELIHTRDGGQTWRWLGPISVDGDTSGIKFLDEQRGVAVGSFGVLRTLDGGVSWSRQAENYSPVSGIALTNGFNGQAVGEFPGVVEVIDGTGFGRQFEIAGAQNPQLIGITNTHSGSLFACGKNGFVARGTNSGDWRGLNASTTTELDVIFFASDRVGWAIGKQGTVITTRDGGEHWTTQITPGDKDLKDIYFSSESHGFAVGNGGTVIGTDDGGQHWYPVVAAGPTSVGGYAWLPAPWYFVSLIVLFGLVRRIPDEIPPVTRQGIAELLASDKPIGPGDPDYLGFQQTALGLSNYLRNNATKPPLTVAITGEWGMGKSSLMNLVQGDLRSYKFRPVWFNAWHHQTEESLLAALLENVRTQAIPSIFTPEGVVFRTKLLWLRARRNLFVFLLVVAAVSFCITYFTTTNTH